MLEIGVGAKQQFLMQGRSCDDIKWLKHKGNTKIQVRTEQEKLGTDSGGQEMVPTPNPFCPS
jgi:hypothetical protein